MKPRSPGVDFSARLRRFLGDLGAAVSQPAAGSVTQPRRGRCRERGEQISAARPCPNGGSHGPGARDKPQLHLVREEMKCRKTKARSLWSGCPSKDEDKPSLLTEMLLISIANRCPEPGAGETPCAGEGLANERKFPRDPFHLWAFSSGHAAATTREGSTFSFF